MSDVERPAPSEETELSTGRALAELSRMNNQLATLQRELARTNARLRVVTEEKDRVLGMVVHDLRNPLSVLAMNLTLLADDPRVQSVLDVNEIIVDMTASAEQMKVMLGDLLDVTAIEAGRLDLRCAPADLGAVVRATVRRAAQLASRKGTVIRYEEDRAQSPGETDVELDERRISQVLDNLLSNAVKYSAAGSEVIVVLRKVDGSKLAVEVRDRGPGIAPSELSKLFTPFGKTSARPTAGESSTGLGLAIAKRIAEAHGGTIEVETAVGKGSTFRLVLPRTQ